MGFMFTWPLASAVYNFALGLFFLTKVQCGWTEAKANRCFKPVHIVAIATTLVFGISGLATNSFHPNAFFSYCSFGRSSRCLEDQSDDTNADPCDTDRKSTPMMLGLSMSILILMLSALSIACVWLLHAHVRKQGQRNERYSFSSQPQSGAAQRMRDRAVFIQAACYTASYCNIVLTILITLVYRSALIHDESSSVYRSNIYFPMRLFVTIMFPLQGFFNWVIFVRPSLCQWRTSHPNRSYIWAYRQVLQGRAAPVAFRNPSRRQSPGRPSDLIIGSSPCDVSTLEQSSSLEMIDHSDVFTLPLDVAETRRQVRMSQVLQPSQLRDIMHEVLGDLEESTDDEDVAQPESAESTVSK